MTRRWWRSRYGQRGPILTGVIRQATATGVSASRPGYLRIVAVAVTSCCSARDEGGDHGPLLLDDKCCSGVELTRQGLCATADPGSGRRASPAWISSPIERAVAARTSVAAVPLTCCGGGSVVLPASCRGVGHARRVVELGVEGFRRGRLGEARLKSSYTDISL